MNKLALDKFLIPSIQSALESGRETSKTVYGWLQTVRKQKRYWFAELSDGLSSQSLQIVIPEGHLSAECKSKLVTGASISAVGVFQKSQGGGQAWELLADRVAVLGSCNSDVYPIQKKEHSDEFLRSQLHLRLRTEKYARLARIRHRLLNHIYNFYNAQQFIQVHPPIITEHDCEGGGESFRVDSDARPNFFSKPAYLSVSSQLHLELAASSLARVFSMMPVFRAENHHTSRHLAEFWMLECEMSFVENLSVLLDFSEDFIKSCIDVIICDVEVGSNSEMLNELSSAASKPFGRISYSEVVEILIKNQHKFIKKVDWGSDLQTEHERFIAEEVFKGPVFVTDYPDGIKPFYMKKNSDNRTVACMDLLVPGIGEILGGSLRENDCSALIDSMGRKLSRSAMDSLSWYTDLRVFGSAPHGGFGFGFDRFLQYSLGIPNIRDVILIPRVAGSIKF